MDEEMSKLVALKIAQTYTANEEAVLKSIFLVFYDNSSTLLFILDNSGLKNVSPFARARNLLLACTLIRVSCALVHIKAKKFQWTRSGQAPSQVGF